ncbi:MAG: CPBP family intramembrane metalloprotease, partial [Bacteroidaceae bacterium]|nr:CPBP family intramembrane metalloprotease [Bacteroidaceae bacterium]
SGASPTLIGLALLFIIGPAEEIFWRGFVQRTLTARFSATRAFVFTTLVYTLIHVPSGNFMLVMAAMTCGIAWGGLYRLFPQHFTAIVLSHALWDAAAFVWFPF